MKETRVFVFMSLGYLMKLLTSRHIESQDPHHDFIEEKQAV